MMYNIHHMRRTQLYLGEDDYARLTAIGKSTGKTLSELVREAVRRSYEQGISSEQRLALLRSAFGIWKKRRMSDESYVRQLRKGKRIRNLWK